MKTFTLKKITALACISVLAGFATISAAVTHGSIKGVGVPFYTQGTAGGNIANPIATTVATLDYKVVTKGSKSWAYLKFNGTSGIDVGAAWTCQFRYWSSANAKTENNLTEFRDATSKVIYGSATSAIPNPLNISFFQNLNAGGFSETLLIPYDVTAKNSPVSGDVTAPSITACDVTPTETTGALTLTGSDDSGDLFYYIVDAAHNIEQFTFGSAYTLTGLTASTTYNLTITPIDFNGNEGTPFSKSFTTAGLIQITSGIAQDIKFALKSTGSTLEYYYEYTDPTKKFRDATLGITPAGGTAFDIKPTISPDSTYCYGTTNDASINGKIIGLNFKYFTYKLPVDYAEWVVANSTITSGTLTGTPIKHQMGSGPSVAETETTVPALASVTLVDATPGYIKLNINGNDNSGTVYYSISGAKSTVNAYRTGNYYLTAIDPGNVYTLTIKPYDLSGNTAATKTLTVKTMPARSNIKDSTNCNYNTTVLPTAPAGELTSIIKLNGNVLTLGCTTKSLLIPAGNRNKIFNNPSVIVNGTTYPLTLDANNTTATVTFTDAIGVKALTSGNLFTIKWSIYWGAAGVGGIPAGGNFFTGTFNYVVGDNGQTDVSGPSTPGLTLAGSSLTWPACTDDLSGVKSYLVSETGQTPVTVFDLGGTSFSYTMVNPAAVVTVKSIDFVGNKSLVASKNDVGTATTELNAAKLSLYPNPAVETISFTAEVARAEFFTLQGQMVHAAYNQTSMDVSSFAKGLYIVRLTDKSGNQSSTKLEIR